MKAQLRFEIVTRINKIYDSIKDSPISFPSSVIGGELSKALFYAYYSKFNKKKQSLELTMDILEKVSPHFNVMIDGGIGLSNGIVGYGWILSHLEEEKFLDTGASKILNLIDQTILPKALTLIKEGHYDHLHGALGTGVYFLSRKASNKANLALEKIIIELKNISITEGGFVKWPHYDYEMKSPSHGQYNFGLSHGMPSIILFLIRCHQVGIMTDTTRKLITGGIKYLISQHQNCGIGGSYFPYTITETKELQKSRLAWCYGDLGILYLIVLANKMLDIKGIDSFIKEVIDFEVKRKGLKENQIYDSAFCHGTAGIAHLFQRISKLYNLIELPEITNYWYQETLNLGHHEDGYAGFKKFTSKPEPHFSRDFGLLEGVSGIGLTLLSAITPTELKWDQIFMLS